MPVKITITHFNLSNPMLKEIYNPNQHTFKRVCTMLKAIYAPNNLPVMFTGIKPAVKLKTKFTESLIIGRPEMDSTDEPLLNIWFNNGLVYQSVNYSTADIITKKRLKDVVPLILVLQDFNNRLYLALTYIKFFAPENPIPANQLNMFANEKTN